MLEGYFGWGFPCFWYTGSSTKTIGGNTGSFLMLSVNRLGLGVVAGLAIGLFGMGVEAAPITYQGVLEDGGSPADGVYEMQFVLGDSAVFGIALQFLTPMDVVVSDGLFEVEIDFDDVHFDGSDRWMEVRVEGEFLSPRTKINYAPYAIRASHADHAGVASELEVPWVVVTDTDVVDATSTRGIPIRGLVNSTSLSGPGVLGETNSFGSGAVGVLGRVNQVESNDSSIGVHGENLGRGIGVNGQSLRGGGVVGISEFGDGVIGSSHTGYGVDAHSNFHYGVRARTLNGLAGILGVHTTFDTTGSLGSEEYGAAGYNTGTEGAGTGVYGEGGRIGIQGVALPDGFGSDLTRVGVDGFAGGFTTGANMIYGIRGFAQNPANGGGRTAYGVYGGAQVGSTANTAYGVYGEAVGPSGIKYAGYFQGNVHVAGTLSKSSGSFKIDHPMDPENKYLSHSFVESPEMMNVYSGMVTLDKDGRGVVELPHYFDSLNADYRYQLTAIGAAMPGLHVAEVIEGNVFVVGGGVADKQVSWDLTGVRIDASASYRPIVVEEDKAEKHRGKYLDPEAHGFGSERAIHRSGNETSSQN